MEMDRYEHGVPSWVDVSSPDVDRAVAFYSALFGWDVDEGSPETGGYRLAMLGGRTVCGIAPLMNPGPPAWTTYVNVDSADGIAKLVKDNGGMVFMEPMDVLDIGRMAFFSDPTGAVFGVWQPKTFTGADLVNAPNSLCWNDVLTRDADACKAFYTSVFGWVAGRPSFPGAPDSYTIWELSGRPVGGMMQMDEESFPAEVPPHWTVCFAVADCDGTVAKARVLGATVTIAPMDMPIGRFAGLIDPQGASFSLMQSS